MVRPMAAVLRTTLAVDPDGSGEGMPVGEPAWVDRLAGATVPPRPP
jgi:hypothetical protein